VTAGAWSTPSIVREKAATWWRGGRLLRELQAPGAPPMFPARIRLVRPTKDEVADRFVEVRVWASRHLAAAADGGWQVETRPVAVRALGPQEIPSALVVPDSQTALAALGASARRDAKTFARCLQETRSVGAWAEQVALAKPLDVVAAAADWPDLLRVVEWVGANPRPGVHIRALPVPGAHSKLVENNKALFGALLLARLPAEAVDADAVSYEERFGFATGERVVVLRAPGAVVGLPHLAFPEVTWPAAGLAGLDPAERGIDQVVVVENRACLPMVAPAEGRVVVWGAGYGAGDLLSGIGWLDRVDVVYWGDLDTHGLAILDAVRAVVPGARSVMMDVATLEAHPDQVGIEPVPRDDDLAHLTVEEQELYRRLRACRQRVEQEHLSRVAIDAAFTPGLQVSQR
jgi:hypothetical protein